MIVKQMNEWMIEINGNQITCVNEQGEGYKLKVAEALLQQIESLRAKIEEFHKTLDELIWSIAYHAISNERLTMTRQTLNEDRYQTEKARIKKALRLQKIQDLASELPAGSRTKPGRRSDMFRQ